MPAWQLSRVRLEEQPGVAGQQHQHPVTEHALGLGLMPSDPLVLRQVCWDVGRWSKLQTNATVSLQPLEDTRVLTRSLLAPAQ